jgi:hypothetical protein
MNTTLTPFAPRAVHDAEIRSAQLAHRISTAIHGPSDEWDRLVIARVIRYLATAGQPFSVNDARDYLPAVRTCLISRGFIAAQREGLLEKCGYTPSTLASTKGAVVAVYKPVSS